MTSATSKHYESHTTESYESAYFYSPGAYTEWLCDLVRSSLGVDQRNPGLAHRRMIDIGGGTGNFTKMVIEGVRGMDAVIVDPFLEGEKNEKSNADSSVQFVKESAEAFAAPDGATDGKELWWQRDYHQILMKEVVHHFAEADRVDIFRGMRLGLCDAPLGAPSVLIVTRPQKDIDYPLWPQAREVWAKNQPSAASIKADLLSAGFESADHTIHSYPCEIKLERWLRMVKGRFWSTFSNFTDEELEDACNIIRNEARLDEDGLVRFEDRLVFITASINR